MVDASVNSAPYLPGSQWAESQGKLLQDTWLLALFAVLLAVSVPWFVSSLQIDFAEASVALLLLAAIYVSLVLAGMSGGLSDTMRRRLIGLLHAAGVVGLGLLWQRSGGLQNPALLLAFALPVIGSAALSRWRPYATAALAIVVIGAVAFIQAPELRWYIGGVHEGIGWLGQLFSSNAQGGERVLPGFYAPVGYDIALLEVSAILLMACAVVAESLGNAYEKLLDHLRSARSEAVRGQELWTRLMLQLPLPGLLVEADTLQILLSSRETAPFWPEDEILTGRPLFEAMRCAYPERLQELIAGDGGVADAVVVHVRKELRVARVHVRQIVFDGRRLTLVMLEDTTDAFCTAAALDAQEHPLIVIDAHSRVVAASRPARALFPEIGRGSDASGLLSGATGTAGLPRWWEPGLTGRRRTHVTLLRRTYLTTSTAVPLPGEDQVLYVVDFAPVLPAEIAAGNLPAMSVVR